MPLPKVHNSSITKFKDTEIVEMSDKEFKSLVFKKPQRDSNKQINEGKKSIQDLDEKFSHLLFRIRF
jgi:hypothetical protein